MKIRNFEITHTFGEGDRKKTIAKVDVTIGLFRKRTARRTIMRGGHDCKWFFADTSKFTPSGVIEKLIESQK